MTVCLFKLVHTGFDIAYPMDACFVWVKQQKHACSICCSSLLCCDWLASLRDAYAGRTKAFHWTPALRKKLTGHCSTALDQSSCTIELTTTVSAVFIDLVRNLVVTCI